MNLVTPKVRAKHDLLFNKLASTFRFQGLFSKHSFFVVTYKWPKKLEFVVPLKSDLDDQQTGLRGGFVEHLSAT